MTNDELLKRATHAAEAALRLTKTAWNDGQLAQREAERLKDAARLLHCAATELEARSRGVPPPLDTRD